MGLGHGAMFQPEVGAGCTGDPRLRRGRPSRAGVAEGIRLLPNGSPKGFGSYPASTTSPAMTGVKIRRSSSTATSMVLPSGIWPAMISRARGVSR